MAAALSDNGGSWHPPVGEWQGDSTLIALQKTVHVVSVLQDQQGGSQGGDGLCIGQLATMACEHTPVSDHQIQPNLQSDVSATSSKLDACVDMLHLARGQASVVVDSEGVETRLSLRGAAGLCLHSHLFPLLQKSRA